MSLPGEDPPGQSADQLQPLGRRVDQGQLGERQRVPQPREPVHQFRRVGRASADHREFHPLTPVNVTPSMKALWAKKNTTTTGAVTSRFTAIIRFQDTWWAPRNV